MLPALHYSAFVLATEIESFSLAGKLSAQRHLSGRRLVRGVVRKAAAIALVASALAMSPAAASGDALVNTVQSPPNPVPFGQDVTLTITVTNTGPRAFPSGNEADTVLSLFVLRAQSDRVAPNTYTSVTGANGQACVPTAAKVPFVDCALSGFPAGATTTFTAVINAQVSVDHSISVEACRVDCGQLGQGDVTTIVGCGVPALAGRLVADARRALAAQNCALGKVSRKSAPKRKRGRVLAQTPAPATQLPPGAKVAVVLAGP